jgi:hypothetical protein
LTPSSGTSRPDPSARPAAAGDALTAHAMTVRDVALTEITDATEGHALTTLLAGS